MLGEDGLDPAFFDKPRRGRPPGGKKSAAQAVKWRPVNRVLCDLERKYICEWKKDLGLPNLLLARMFKCALRTVERALECPEPAVRCPPPHEVKRIEARHKIIEAIALIQHVNGQVSFKKFHSAPQIQREYNRRLPLNRKDESVSVDTVRRDLADLGWVYRKCHKRPIQLQGDDNQRFRFCGAMLRRKAYMKDYEAFSDEWVAKEGRFTPPGCWLKGDAPRIVREMIPVPKTVKVFALIARSYRYICLIDGSMNSKAYIEQCLQPMKSKLIRYNVWLQQDGARFHFSKETRAYLEKSGIEYLDDWPPRSPQLNPIEHVWYAIGHLMRKHGLHISDTGVLWEVIEMIFYAIPQSYIDGLCESFWRRVGECHAASGKVPKTSQAKKTADVRTLELPEEIVGRIRGVMNSLESKMRTAARRGRKRDRSPTAAAKKRSGKYVRATGRK